MPISERIVASGVRSPKDFLNGTEESLIEKEEGDEGEDSQEDNSQPLEVDVIIEEPPVPIVYEDSLHNEPQVQSNSAGWCWVSGVPGEGASCADAMINALDKLQGINIT
jgi:hypothetical protein